MKNVLIALSLATIMFAPQASAYPESFFDVFFDVELQDDAPTTNALFDVFFDVTVVGQQATDAIHDVLYDVNVIDSVNSEDSFFDIFFALETVEHVPVEAFLNVFVDVEGPSSTNLDSFSHIFFMIDAPQAGNAYTAFSTPLVEPFAPKTYLKGPLAVDEPTTMAIAAVGLLGLTFMRRRLTERVKLNG